MADNYNLLNDFMEQLHNAVYEHNKEHTPENVFDSLIVTKINSDGIFKLIECMTPHGMLALCTTIIEDWMEDRLKPEMPMVERHKMVDDMTDVMKEVLHDWVNENFAK